MSEGYERTAARPGRGDGSGGGRGGGSGGGRGGGRGDGAGPGAGRRRGARSGRQDKVLYPRTELDADAAATMVFCVDDTDDLTGDTSTGYVAERIAEAVGELGGNVQLGITRHQLLLAEGVPYTSHNSAMAVVALVPRDAIAACYQRAVALVESMSVPGSDPGLCAAVLPEQLSPADEAALARLEAFGARAQTEVCTKEEAYALAATVPWLRLSEHGGTGQGVIGALAGCGLRLGGADGRFRGKWDLERILDTTSPVKVGAFCEAIGKLAGGEVAVVNRRKEALGAEELVQPVCQAKPVLWRGSLAFVVEQNGACYVPAEKVDLGKAGSGADWERVCERFSLDNDSEECADAQRESCRNCLFRRWTERGFTCEVKPASGPAPEMAR